MTLENNLYTYVIIIIPSIRFLNDNISSLSHRDFTVSKSWIFRTI